MINIIDNKEFSLTLDSRYWNGDSPVWLFLNVTCPHWGILVMNTQKINNFVDYRNTTPIAGGRLTKVLEYSIHALLIRIWISDLPDI